MTTPKTTPQDLIGVLLDRVREFTESLTEQQIDDLLSGRSELILVDATEPPAEPWEVTSGDGTVFENWGAKQEIMRQRGEGER